MEYSLGVWDKSSPVGGWEGVGKRFLVRKAQPAE